MMKTGFFSLTAVSLLQLSHAQPAHIGGIAHKHARRDVVTEVDYVTAATPDVMVYVNQNGEPISTSYGSAPSATAEAQPSADAVSAQAVAPSAPAEYTQAPAAQPQSAAKTTSQQAAASAPASYAPAPSSQAAPASYAPASSSQAAPVSSAPAASASSSPSSGSSSGGSQGLGINYSPYHGDHSCKTADEVSKDFQAFSDYGVVRSYGTDCNQVQNMMSAAKAKNMKIMLGIYNPQEVGNELALMVSGVKAAGDWGMVHSVSVGNEAVNSGQASVSQVLNALGTAKATLKGAGYNGKVVTVDTFDTLIAHPELCQNSDYAAANAHAFFDAQTSADQAGKWAQGTVQRVKQACGGKDVIITESGWPTQGSANGAAVPSKENQQTAMSSLKSAFPSGGLFLFSAYNDLWKSDFSGSFGCEKYWGIMGDSPN